ncbi:acetyltransferase [Actinomyces sp. B33]|uniref:acyltransferase n=1 Tax=Actinomyces sp. B33 TaxID=2942131 RepID=UPI0023418B0A|nr:acyltransferase [Actinomyces sp. B33]MDC4232631.1 acetyltransferase [Actinomyces sp. B33]
MRSGERSAVASIEQSADVDPTAVVGSRTRVWHLAQIRQGARIGDDCVIGRGAYIGAGVSVGAASKIQNHALVYEPADLGPGVFIGPAAVLTNDRFPRAANPDLTVKTGRDWQRVGVVVREGASVGARAVCVAPVTIGRWALVAAGAVVTRDVPDFALVAGAPARRVGWVGRAGVPLDPDPHEEGVLVCPATGARYRLTADGALVEETPEARDDA